MKTITVNDIRALKPCYDPVTGLNGDGLRCNDGFVAEEWTGTVVDILQDARIPAEDRLWVAIGLVDERTARLFAVWCAREAIRKYDPNPDPRSIAACDVAERYANGQAPDDELAPTKAAAKAAARAAAFDAAWDAARDAAFDAAWDAARAAAFDAAWDAARDEQITHLIGMLEPQP